MSDRYAESATSHRQHPLDEPFGDALRVGVTVKHCQSIGLPLLGYEVRYVHHRDPVLLTGLGPIRGNGQVAASNTGESGVVVRQVLKQRLFGHVHSIDDE